MDWNRAFFTTNHRREHDNEKWCIRDVGGLADSCILCMIDVLESSTELILHKRHTISSVLSLLQHGKRAGSVSGCQRLVDLLRKDVAIASQFVFTFVGLIANEDQRIAKMSAEGAAQLLQVLQIDDVTSNALSKIIQLVSQSESQKCSIPYLQLVNQLLQRKQIVAKYMLTLNGGELVGFLQCAIGSVFNDEMKSLVVSIVVHMVEELGWIPLLHSLAINVPRQILRAMHLTQHYALKLNALTLVRLMISNPLLLKTLFEVNCDGITFPLIIKRYLLCSQDRQARFMCIQCINAVLRSDNTCLLRDDYAERLLQNDTATFLFETIGTTDDELLESALECCLLLTDVPAFFQGCHAIYGIQAVILSVDISFAFSTVQSSILGLKLVKTILERHMPGSALFCNVLSVAQMLDILGKGLRHSHNEVSFQSAGAAAALFKKRHLLSPIPFQTICSHVQVCSEWMQQLLRVHLLPSKSSSQNVTNHTLRSAQVTMELIYSAFQLCIDCCDDPTSMVEIYEVPLSENEDKVGHTDFEELLHFLHSCLENILVPLILSCPAFLSCASVFEHFFNCLSSLFHLQGSSEAANIFAQLLVSSDFLRLTFHSHAMLKDLTKECADRVHRSRNTFLTSIINQLIAIDRGHNATYEAVTEFSNSSQTCKGISDFQEVVREGLVNIRMFLATDTDFHSISYLDPQQLESVQTTFLAVCYYSSLFGHNLFPASVMLPALNNHLLSKQTASNGVNEKFILFLMAVCSYELVETDDDSDITASYIATSRDATQVLVRHICSMKDPASAYTHHRVLLKWVFSLDEVTDSIGIWMFRQCLLCSISSCQDGTIHHKDSIEMDRVDMDVILNILDVSERFSSMFMDKIFNKDATLSTHIFKILEQTVEHECSDIFKRAFFLKVPKMMAYFTTPCYLHQIDSLKAVNLLLRLLSNTLHFNEENRHLLAFENGFNILQQGIVKPPFYYVCTGTSVEKTIQWLHENKQPKPMPHALQCLNLLLAHFVYSEDSRGATILLMSTKILSTVAAIVAVTDCEKEILTEAFLILSLLSHHQRKTRLEITNIVSIPFWRLRKVLFSSEKHMVLGSLQILNSQLVHIEDPRTCIHVNPISENESDALDFEDLTVIYSTLLNLLLKERSNLDVKDTILCCLLDVLAFTERKCGHLDTGSQKLLNVNMPERYDNTSSYKITVDQMAGDLWTGMAIGKLIDEFMDISDLKFISKVLKYVTQISEWGIDAWLRTFHHFLDIFEEIQQKDLTECYDISFRNIPFTILHEIEEIVSKWPNCAAITGRISRALVTENRSESNTANASQDIF